MASITIVFRKDKLNGQREGPVHFRITKNRKSSYIASGIRVLPHHWDEKKSKVKATCPNSARLNAYLSGRFAEIQDTVLQHESSDRLLSSKQNFGMPALKGRRLTVYDIVTKLYYEESIKLAIDDYEIMLHDARDAYCIV